jgi:FkbM family methyltransferase
MGRTFRVRIKEKFDGIVYKDAFLNRVVRNINKALSPLTSFRLRPFGVLRLSFRSGLRIKLATNETSAVAKKLFWKGPDHYEYTAVFEVLVKKCSAFADIGASLGYYSVLAARANPQIRVYAFEPASAPFHFLKRNVHLNALENRVDVFDVALSNSSGQIEFHELRNPEGGPHSVNLGGTGKILTDRDSRENIVPVLVKTETADIFFEKRSPVPDLIKMDTEGTEHMILEGAKNLLRKYKPIIICETLFQVIEPELDRLMRDHGYHFYNFVGGKLIRTETLIRKTDDGVRDCVFVHPEKESLIREFL